MEQELKFTINQQFKEQFKKQLCVDCFQDDQYKNNTIFSVYLTPYYKGRHDSAINDLKLYLKTTCRT